MDYKHEYEEMVRRCKELHESGNALTKAQMEIVCPQLAESEDERMVRIIEDVICTKEGEAIAQKYGLELTNLADWLEKQKDKSMSATEVLIRAGLKPYKDGNQWCILAGDNIQEGICGFGDTIDEALYQFLTEVLEKQNEQKPISFNGHYNPDDYEVVMEGNATGLRRKEQKPNYCHHEVDETGLTEEYRKAYYDGWNNCNMQHSQLQAEQEPAEWSEEDVEKLAKNRANKSGTLKSEMIFYRQGVRDAFNYKGMHPSWKPSEEQMEALKESSTSWMNEYMENCEHLKSLYNDLKKL